MRLCIPLLLAGAAAAAPKAPEGHEPFRVEHEMRAEGVEVHLLLEWRSGLYAVTDDGEVEAAWAGVRIEYNDADRRSGGFTNPFEPAALQADRNPDWAAAADEPGLWLTRGASTDPVARRIVFRFPRRGRYRIRVAGLFEDTGRERVAPFLAAVTEVAEDEPSCECPFCGTVSTGVVLEIRGVRHYPCRYCDGAVHVYPDGRRRGSLLHDGKRRFYDLVDGRLPDWDQELHPVRKRRSAVVPERPPPPPPPTATHASTAPPPAPTGGALPPRRGRIRPPGAPAAGVIPPRRPVRAVIPPGRSARPPARSEAARSLPGERERAARRRRARRR